MNVRLLRVIVLFLIVTGVSTWMGTLPGSAAFALGIGFGVFVIRPVLRWADQ